MSDSVVPSFLDVQRRFAAHVGDPANIAPPNDVSSRRMSVYTDLFFRNLEQHLAAGFPVIRRITPDARWHDLVRGFMARHRCRTPLFPEIGREFSDFLSASPQDPVTPAFLAELAHYEHLEVTVAFSEDDAQQAAVRECADLLNARLVFSASVRVGLYAFPVHLIGPDYQPETAPAKPTYLLVYRDADDRVRFMELNAMSYTLIGLLRIAHDQTALAVLTTLAASIGHRHADEVESAGLALLRDLCMRGIIIGEE